MVSAGGGREPAAPDEWTFRPRTGHPSPQGISQSLVVLLRGKVQGLPVLGHRLSRFAPVRQSMTKVIVGLGIVRADFEPCQSVLLPQ